VASIARFEIRIAGFGGQGVVTIGKVLGTAFTVYEKRNSVNTQSYGPESRGGACRSEVVVSDGDINYPYVRKADVFVALSQVAFEKYISDLKPEGSLVIDPNAVEPNAVEIDLTKEKFHIYRVPSMALAHEAGSLKYQNSVALGALYPLIGSLVKEASLRKALSENVPQKTIEGNLEAFDKGLKYIQTLNPEPVNVSIESIQ
jgi:2-oxoglutarate ferredoxin oxidoreductase subunit gamma